MLFLWFCLVFGGAPPPPAPPAKMADPTFPLPAPDPAAESSAPSMIIISGSMRLKQGDRSELIEATRRMMAATLEEAGCRAYRFTFDLIDPDLLHVYEEWDDETSLMTHFAEPHFAEFGTTLRDWVDEGGSILRHEVGHSRPLM